MTFLAPEVLRRVLGSHEYPAIATGTGAVVSVLLIVLLAELQLVHAAGAKAAARPLRAFVFPLLLAFAFVVGLRIVQLLPYH